MSDIQDLYQDMVLDHSSRPRNFRKLEDANRSADGYNPLCGDKITLYLKVEDDKITDVGFESSGCAISKASASMMTQSIKGKSPQEAEETFRQVHQMLTRDPDFESDDLSELEVLSGVSQFPTRVKCATLAWYTLRAAFKSEVETVKTEED